MLQKLVIFRTTSATENLGVLPYKRQLSETVDLTSHHFNLLSRTETNFGVLVAISSTPPPLPPAPSPLQNRQLPFVFIFIFEINAYQMH